MTNTDFPEILVVDHTNINVDLIKSIFSKHQISVNFEITHAVPDLLTRLEEKPWQAIFLIVDDIPVSVSALIEAMPAINKKCPIIVLSKEYDREAALEHIQSGAQDVFSLDEIDYLVKRFNEILKHNQSNNTIKKQRQALKESYERFLALSKKVPIAIAFIHEGAFMNINPAFQHFFNFNDPDEITEISFLDLVADEDIERVKSTLQQFSKDNSDALLESVSVKKSADDISKVNLFVSQTTIAGESGLQVIFQPCDWHIKPSKAITDYKELLSPEFFIQSLNQVIRKNNKKQAYSLCFFEVDAYSRIKKNIGITRSDHLLHEIADFMSEHASANFKISRLNSDVFTLLVTDKTPAKCIDTIKALQEAFTEHAFNSIDRSMNVASNIGILHISDQVHTPDQALSLADVACTVSRNRKKNLPHIYNPEEDRSTVEQVDQNWTDKINDALRHNNFKLLFQPIVSLGNKQEKLYEVLLRIKGSGNEDTLPNQFLHVARQSGLESDIDKWVIKHAIYQLRKNEDPDIRFFINLSDTSLKDIAFIEWLEADHKEQVNRFVFEIPEFSCLKWQSEALHFVQEIKNMGAGICIDQYGNHPESKPQIDALHADFYKIDGAFVNNLSTNRKHQSIVHNICLETKNSDTQTIANYVQDADSLAILWREGVDFIQGNYLQAPAAHLNFKFEAQI